ncbi:MAG: succinate dehydrogenase assembly factor 2, partial [Acidimicrobiales bacterium]|nr:succinate dehydrogenase assembly factor 2 [Acidimicrobiales bacterium]
SYNIFLLNMNKLDVIKRKIKYRSKYRSIKEMDLLLGNFVKKYIDIFDYNELLSLYEILEKDDDDIFKWYTGKEENINILKNKVSDTLKKFKLK